jgi:hypothetical protein
MVIFLNVIFLSVNFSCKIKYFQLKTHSILMDPMHFHKTYFKGDYNLYVYSRS